VSVEKTMTNHFTKTAEASASKPFSGDISGGVRTLWRLGAGVGLLGGTFVLAAAVFLMIFQFLGGEVPHGSWLFAVVLPLWILGAHCFDKLDETDQARRVDFENRLAAEVGDAGASKDKAARRLSLHGLKGNDEPRFASR
jgi:hypothetical protein